MSGGPAQPAFEPLAGPVRWGVLGAGRMAQALAGLFAHTPGGTLAAVAASDKDRAAAVAGPYGATAYGDYQDLVEDPAVDAVYVALSNDAHEPWSTAALTAGKSVLCEKPLGLSATEVGVLAAAAQLSARLLVEAFWYRWQPRVRAAEAALAAGAVGTVRHVTGAFAFGGVAADNYRLDAGRGGGALYDVGCYPVSAALWAAGRGLPDEVAARTTLGETGVDLAADLLLSWEDCDAELHCGMAETSYQRLVVTGEHGEVELPGEAFTTFGPSELWVSDGSGTRREPVAAGNAYQIMIDEVTSVLRGGPGWVVPLAHSRAVAAVLDAAFVSAARGGAAVRP